jgi:hypothetical protein
MEVTSCAVEETQWLFAKEGATSHQIRFGSSRTGLAAALGLSVFLISASSSHFTSPQ